MNTPEPQAGRQGPRRKHAQRRRNRNAVAVALSDIPMDKANCWIVLDALLAMHNHQHTVKEKDVSYKTQAERRTFLHMAFRQLAEDGFHLDPRSLRPKHIQALVDRWIAEGYEAKTIQTYLSFLRALGDWIGKPGLVRPATYYVDNPYRVRCSGVAQRDKSWLGADVDADEKIAEVAALNPIAGGQLAMMFTHGLRVKEALMLQPHLAVVPAAETDIASPTADSYLCVDRGSKGGRRRYVPIDSGDKWAAIERAQALVPKPDGHLGFPDCPLKQSMTRFRNLMASVGITLRGDGVVPHGLRHGYAQHRYQQIAGVAAPVCGGRAPDRETDMNARLAVSADLGHVRGQITGAYLGPLLRSHAQEIHDDEEDPSP
jgi:integrase